MAQIEIRHRYTNAGLFMHETTDERMASGLAMRDALERAAARKASLYGADLRGADLRGAGLRGGLKAEGERPLLCIGPIGSESRTIYAWITDHGLRIQAGCFWGDRAELLAAFDKTHGTSVHGDEYRAAVVLIDAHARLWTPAAADVAAVAEAA